MACPSCLRGLALRGSDEQALDMFFSSLSHAVFVLDNALSFCSLSHGVLSLKVRKRVGLSD